MAIVKTFFQVLLLILLVMLATACHDATAGLTADELWKNFLNTLTSPPTVYAWIIIVVFQIFAMKWLGGVWNVIFSIMSFLLLTELVMIAGGLEAAITPRLFTLVKAAGYADITAKFPVIYWLVPVLWLLSCFCAKDQVRVFLTAICCYALWLLLSWLLCIGVDTWLSMGEPQPEKLADTFRMAPWLTSALPACFLLIYALLMAIFEACIKRSKA